MAQLLGRDRPNRAGLPNLPAPCRRDESRRAYANLSDARLVEAYMDGATQFDGALFDGADLRGADYFKSTPVFVDLVPPASCDDATLFGPFAPCRCNGREIVCD